MYSHLAHPRRFHILGYTTECNVALDQSSCSKTSGMVFCISKGHKQLGGSLMYQVLKEYSTYSGSSGISAVGR